VQLQLQANGQAVLEDPATKLAAVEHAVHRREENRRALGEPALAHDLARPLIVGTAVDHELGFVVRAQPVDVRPVHPMRLPRSRRLDVQDHAGARVERRS
jgi:hypothetical protein